MNFENLMKNLSDVIVEEQLKLGYRRETVRLYYPPASLQRLLGVEGERAHLEEALHGFCAEARGTLGEVTAVMDAQGGRYCLAVPPQGVQYIHENMGEAPFIAELIRLIERADCTLDDVLSLFQSRSLRVNVVRTACCTFPRSMECFSAHDKRKNGRRQKCLYWMRFGARCWRA